MPNINLTDYHPRWQESRVRWMLGLYPEEFWNGKNVLELAPFNGVIGDFFRSIGANVLSVEGRPENIKRINEGFPLLNVIEGNLDCAEWPYGNFDIIINFGLFYHLENYHVEHLNNCINHCSTMFFESVVFDSNRPELYRTDEKVGDDQSLSKVGNTPSTSFVEWILDKNCCRYVRYSDKELNGDGHTYDWADENKRNYKNQNRRMWVVKCRLA